ncbi:MAG: ABC transporter ATP-binding protein/permease [Treponema sp.]|nr:ABC transporter ATP-binding protein/permease [Treponema sp.]
MKWFTKTKTGFVYIGRMFRLLWIYDKAYFFIVIADVVVFAFLPFITMYLIKYSIDMLSSGAAFTSYLPTVFFLLGAQLVARTLFNRLNTSMDVHANMSGIRLFSTLFKKNLFLNYEMLLDKGIMEKYEKAAKVFEGGRFADLSRNFISFASSLLTLGGIVYIVAAGVDFWILLLVVVIIAVNSVFTSKKNMNNRKIFETMAPVNRRLNYFMNTLGSDTSFGKEVRLYNMQGALFKIYHGLQELSVGSIKKIFSFSETGSNIYNITSFCLDVVVYGFLGFKLLVRRLITVGDFSLYLNAITTFNDGMQRMITSYMAIFDNGQYLKDYFDYMDIKSRYDSAGRELPAEAVHELTFTFENVSFRYPHQAEPALKNINLTLAGRERLAMVGENGAGKTTLIKLLMRLYDPTEGRILLNGVDIREILYPQYLSLFASVFQDFKLFAFRIIDNICSLRDDCAERDREKIRLCLAQAGLLEKVETLDKGMETYLYKLYEEDGVELSGGESQKLAIARALYKDAPVIILDEPTAALDPRSEYEIYTRFFGMVKDKSSVFITHRLSSTRFCDRIIVLRKGEIVETGSHKDLLARKGYYTELFTMQAQFYTDVEAAGETEPVLPLP